VLYFNVAYVYFIGVWHFTVMCFIIWCLNVCYLSKTL